MRKPFRGLLVAVSLPVMLLPATVYGQSRGTGDEGAKSSYLSGSAATGHHGNSGSTESLRREDDPVLAAGKPASSDQELEQRIHSALTADQGLAASEPGINIDVDAGQVTLRGSVKTEKDKADIGAKASQIAGVTRVDNQLQVAPNLSGTTSGSAAPVTR